MENLGQLLFFFSAIGAFNGILLGIYFLFFARPRDLANRFLGALILMLSIRVGKSVFYYFNHSLAYEYLQLGLTACFFIGPFLYFYTRQLYAPQSKNINREWKYHLLMLVPLAIWFGVSFPYREYVEFWQWKVVVWIYYIWMVYILLSLVVIRASLLTLIRSPRSLNRLETWLISVIFGNLLLVTIYYTSDWTFYISGALSFSFLLYLSWAFLLFNRDDQVHAIFRRKKYGDQKIPDREAKQLLKTLENAMVEQKLYAVRGLKLPDLAAKIDTSPHRLSQFLNDNLKKSFTQFINGYRVAEAKQKIKVLDHLTLEGIGYEVGFSSRSTFYTVFKRETGMTPAAYRDSVV